LDAGSKERIRSQALELGFDAVGFAAATPSEHNEHLQRWLREGRHGEMEWMARNASRRAGVSELMSVARSIIIVGLNANPADQSSDSAGGLVARYARFEDYHRVMEKKLKDLAQILRDGFGESAECRWYVDTGPVLERELAQRAGIGWQSKSSMLISQSFGAWLLLGELITNIEFPPDEPARDHCGTCTRCMDACPTQAITSERRIDARRCIAYLTIELKGSIPEEFRRAIGDRVFGCDDCLAVCPWNRFAREASAFKAHQRNDLARLGLVEIMEMDDGAFAEKFSRTPIKRLGLRRLKRNAAVVLGNVGGPEDLAILGQAAACGDALVAEHAAWAMAEIRGRITS
jgi:epoxyqueuosine reductase